MPSGLFFLRKVETSGETWTHFREGYNALKRVPAAIIVNTLAAFLDFSKIASVLEFHGLRVGIMLTFPKPIPTVWDFVSLPQATSSPTLGFLVVSGLLTLAVTSVLILYYLRYISGVGLLFQTNASSSRVLDIAAYQFILFLFTLFAAVSPSAIFLILIGLFFAFYYFSYATPYIVVIGNKSFASALRECIAMALSGRYLAFVLGYIVLTLLLSVPLTLLTVNGGILGIVVGALLGGMAGLWLTSATLSMVIRGIPQPTAVQ